MVLNKSRLGQAVPAGLLYIQHFFGGFLQVNYLPKNPTFLFFINVSSLDSSSATVLNVLCPFQNFNPTCPNILLSGTLCSSPRTQRLPSLAAVPAVLTQCPKTKMKKRTDRTVMPAITQTHKMS